MCFWHWGIAALLKRKNLNGALEGTKPILPNFAGMTPNISLIQIPSFQLSKLREQQFHHDYLVKSSGRDLGRWWRIFTKIRSTKNLYLASRMWSQLLTFLTLSLPVSSFIHYRLVTSGTDRARCPFRLANLPYT
ncbi:hypothetical protein WHR41_09648 [Cladosporium halotolerans]|uniref:Uncharacterized protein n=1 Tax=Cladosporium halotolerans TaxID=1052096 RepID=A0AB34K9Z1_9PEZI